jgi:predicted nucleic acid-binding protein
VAILVDTGVALSAADRDEPRHLDCAEVMRAYHGELVMASPVVAETAWMIESRLGAAAESRFVRFAVVRPRHVHALELLP